jgi:4-hydroxy-tetrahydrodipicolinate synthase
MNPDEIRSRLKGNIVPVPAQYHEDLSINYSALQEHMQFLISKGIKNFYLAMSASEFDYMTRDERVAVTECVAGTLKDDCILIAQALGGHWFEEQVVEAKRMFDAGAHAIVIAPRGLKEGGKFFSSLYLRGKYSPERHDDYFVNYIEKIAMGTKAPIVYHDKPFASGRGPSLEMLKRIVDIDNVVGLKEHVSDPGVLRKVYGEFGDRLVCFDGFGKTIQFWSLLWGATARHTCWSWFDPETDNQFMACMQSEDLKGAVQIINNEWPIAEAIARTGFQGYKYIMKLMGLPAGPVRIPGEEINQEQKEMIKNAVIQVGLLKK